MDQAYSKVKAAVLSFSIFFIIGAVGRPHAYCCTQLFKSSITISNSSALAHAVKIPPLRPQYIAGLGSIESICYQTKG